MSTDVQHRATDPAVSAWVSANAGAGKTYVLARRVLRLLLDGVDPAHILCLTFTKAAAAEMASRVFSTLAGWTVLDDAALAAELTDIEGTPPPAERLSTARRLFARALDTPGGLKIQTIHAFCERILQQFPFEANVAGGFEVLDDVTARAMRDEARRRVWARAAAAPGGVLGRALADVLGFATDFTHETSIVEFVERRDQIARWVERYGTVDDGLDALRDELDLEPGETMATLRAAIRGGSPLTDDDLTRLHATLTASGTSDRAASARLAPAVTFADPERRADGYLAFFIKSDGDFRAANRLVTRKVSDGWPGLADSLAEEAARLDALVDRMRLVACHQATAALLRLADGAIADYEALKHETGVLDFEDLVVRTARLLDRKGAAAWFHYKLDRGLRHVLVDEAQDTSPRQWQVVKALVDEFFAGEGAVETGRTVFAVGDEKQSIYSFQGAAPAWFDAVRRDLRTRATGGDYAWNDVPLRVSYRSTPAVLSAVDRVFARDAVHAGVSFGAGAPVHEAHRRRAPGSVTIWPLYVPPVQTPPEDWTAPIDHLGSASPERRLARDVAETVAGWLASGERLAATGKRITAGDVLVLTRTRGSLNAAINRELKRRDVPIAGVDRLALTEHIAVLDLMALGRFIQLPADDLSLAAVLKSPLFGLDDEALFRLAHGRGGPLWVALQRLAGDDDSLRTFVERLRGWRRDAARRSPYDFYARLLTGPTGRQAFLARLGPEVDDVLDEFLSLALAYERDNIATLQGFVAWLADADIQVRRDADTERDEVRVMTVHGAKGLEADIVFLIDNGSQPVHSSHDPKLLVLPDDDDPTAPPRGLIWNRGKRSLPNSVGEKLEAWRERAREEYRRLLYVGMTRARDRLVVCGIEKQVPRPEDGWYRLIRDALEPDCREDVRADGEVDLVWEAADADVAAGAAEPERAPPSPPDVPGWLDRAAPPPAAWRREIAPSAVVPWSSLREPPAPRADGLDPRERGDLAHRLLQSLPDLPAGERRSAATRFLSTAAQRWPEGARTALTDEVLAVMDDPAMAPVFAPGSRAEVDVIGRDGDALIAGRIDRLAVTDDRVLIVDFKTGRHMPDAPGDVPEVYVAQMALYRRLLARIYPGRAVEAALVWTAGPRLIVLPEDVMASVKLTESSGVG